MRVIYERHGGLSPKLMNRAPRLDAELSAQEAGVVRALVPPEFYRLASSKAKAPPDAFRYEVGVEDGGRANTVTLSDDQIPPGLRPFIDWLQAKAEALSA